MVYDIGYIEKYGSGIQLMRDLSRSWGNKEPYYNLHPVETKIIFESPIKESTFIEIEENILAGLNERQRNAINYVKIKGSITRSEYMKINKISHKTAHLELRGLVEKKILHQEGKGRATRYL